MYVFCTRFGGAAGQSGDKDKEEETKKEEPNFGLSGKLTAETNTYKVYTCTCMCKYVTA